MSLIEPKRILLPVVALLMLLAAYAGKIANDKVTITGYIRGKEMNETSGIAASTDHPGVYYIHNDSGDTSRFFAITPEGKLKYTYTFKGDPKERLGARDCEDIAVGPGPAKGKSYIYLGDIGDNKSARKYLTIYRFEEPSLTGRDSVQHIETVALHVKYPDSARDAETLMIDPIERLIYIVSKRQNSVKVFTTPLDFKAGDTVVLTERAKIHFGGIPPFKWITAGDISKDGSQILLKNYKDVYYWKRTANMPVWEVMTEKPIKLFYKQEKQGEAIGFTPDGKGYLTASEGIGEPIYYYKIP